MNIIHAMCACIFYFDTEVTFLKCSRPDKDGKNILILTNLNEEYFIK